MSLKKTWFSYVLWAVLTGLIVLITYVSVKKAFAIFPVLAVSGTLVLWSLLYFICSKIKLPTISKWMGRVFHILLFLLIAAAFVMLRIPAAMNVQNAVITEQASYFYQASMVGNETVAVTNGSTLFEQTYINVLSGLFLFLGNKAEILPYFQILLQSVSFILMIVIGWNLQKGFFAWLPAMFYAVSPLSFYAVSDTGPANFWMCITLIGISIICLFEKVWKNKNITYIVLVTAEILFGLLMFWMKADVLLYGKPPFVSDGVIQGSFGVLCLEMLTAGVLLVFYCVSFWINKLDHRSLFIIPFIGYCALLACLSSYEFDVTYFLAMLAVFNLYILITEGLRVTFMGKTEAIAEEPVIVEMASEEPVIKEPVLMEPVSEETAAEVVIDKTAPIENVLPMPKKHVPKVLDYAFEPTEDMMHYDIEIENDEYDY